MLKLTYLSHSSFILDDGNHKVIIDPFITGNPNSPVKVEDISVDYIVLTHAHGDHFGDCIHLAKHNKATIIAVNELANYCADKGAKAHNMHIGGAYNFPFGRIKFTIAHHGSSNYEGKYMGSPAGVVISIGGKNIYHAGDTGLFLDMRLIGELNKIDAMLVPIGGNFTMDCLDAAIAVQYVNPELAIPIHFNTFPVISCDPTVFVDEVIKIGKKARIMEFNETIEL